jgi:hypothetical protein
MSFDETYFDNYIGTGRPYAEVYKRFSFMDDCIRHLRERPELSNVETLCVLGTGPGMILKDLHKAFPAINISGCEISACAHKALPKKYKPLIVRADLRDYVRDLAAAGKKRDLCYTNALMYVPEKSVPDLLKNCAGVFRFMFASIPYEGESFFRDAHRTTLKPKSWWKEQFLKNDFLPLADPDLWAGDRK